MNAYKKRVNGDMDKSERERESEDKWGKWFTNEVNRKEANSKRTKCMDGVFTLIFVLAHNHQSYRSKKGRMVSQQWQLANETT